MRKIWILILTMVLTGLLVCNASASYMSPQVSTSLLSGYAYSGVDYWTWADFSAPNTSTNSEFSLLLESASYESGFGIYTVDDNSNPTEIDTKYQIFSPANEPYMAKTVNVKYEGGNYSLTMDAINDPLAAWTPFGNTFGFYFDVSNTQQTYYTDQQFNTNDTNIDHLSTFYADGYAKVLVFLDDQAGGGDQDFNDMVVKVTDVVAPVPEPGSLLLLGSGLVGLFFARRKKRTI